MPRARLLHPQVEYLSLRTSLQSEQPELTESRLLMVKNDKCKLCCIFQEITERPAHEDAREKAKGAEGRFLHRLMKTGHQLRVLSAAVPFDMGYSVSACCHISQGESLSVTGEGLKGQGRTSWNTLPCMSDTEGCTRQHSCTHKHTSPLTQQTFLISSLVFSLDYVRFKGFKSFIAICKK